MGLDGTLCAADLLRLYRLDLTHCFSQPAAQRHSGTVPYMPWCVCAPNRYLFLHRHFPRFPNTFLLYRWIHPSAVLVCFGVYPLIAIHSVMLALRDFSHIGTNTLYFIRLGFTLQPISSSLLLPLL